jgi:DNA-binding LacI/PurR family transcriptional regulator
MAKITINEISREAGVSIATVSRVINRKGNVSEEVSARVLETAKRLGYQTSPTHAESNRLITVLTRHIAHPFYSDILAGIYDVLAPIEYNMVITQCEFGNKYQLSVHGNFLSERVDGVISFVAAEDIKEFSMSLDPRIPVVQCCEYDENFPYPYIGVDDYKAACNAVSYLYATGRRRIALLNATTNYMFAKKREEGYRDVLSSRGITPDERLIYHLNSNDFHVAFSAACRLLSEDDRPDAFFAVTDIYAVAATRAIHSLNFRIPQDVSVIGFDNLPMALMNEPPLTTVNMPRYEIGRIAAEALVGILQKKPPLSRKTLLEAELVIRNST